MRIKYIAVLSDNIEEDSRFLTQVLGCSLTGEIELQPGNIAGLFSLPGKEVHFALVAKKNAGYNVIILHTKNCLQSYLTMKKSGAKPLSAPRYLASGLVAEFTDSSGNRFILLEERTYEELSV